MSASPIVMVRSRVVDHDVYGRLSVVVHKHRDVEVYECAYLRTENGELLHPEVFRTLGEAVATLGLRFQGLIKYTRALADQRAQKGAAA